MTITTAPPPHATWFDDAHDVIDVTRRSPGLPIPTISPARATFDYRHIVHADAARESVPARAILAAAFGTMFASRAEMAGDDTPRYLLVALLPSGLTVVIISRVEYDLDAAADREDVRSRHERVRGSPRAPRPRRQGIPRDPRRRAALAEAETVVEAEWAAATGTSPVRDQAGIPLPQFRAEVAA